MSENKQKIVPSRRDFIKTINLVSANVLISRLGAEGFFQLFSPEPEYPFHQYSRETHQIIATLAAEHNVLLGSPKRFEDQPNLAWPEEAIAILANEVPLLPPAYLDIATPEHPYHINLVRPPNTDHPYAWGEAIRGVQKRINFGISETFDLNTRLTGVLGEVYGDARTHLHGAVHHEFTHIFIRFKDNLDLLMHWNNAMGWWMHPSGKQRNQFAEDDQLSEELMPEAQADSSSEEEIAVSVSRMRINPQTLNYRRKNFFKKHQPWASWKPVVDYFSMGR